MSTTQEKRESFEVGETVEVISRYGNGQLESRRRAKVIERLRAACRVRFQDGRETTVGFKDLRHVEQQTVPGPRPAPAPPVVEVRRPAMAPAPPPTEVATDADLDAWLQMGRGMVGAVEQRIADLAGENRAIDDELEAVETSRAALDAEAAALRKRRTRNLEQLKELHARRETISKLTGSK